MNKIEWSQLNDINNGNELMNEHVRTSCLQTREREINEWQSRFRDILATVNSAWTEAHNLLWPAALHLADARKEELLETIFSEIRELIAEIEALPIHDRPAAIDSLMSLKELLELVTRIEFGNQMNAIFDQYFLSL